MKASEYVWSATVLIAIFFLASLYECNAYDECRRYHPAWYCIGEGSK